MVVLCVPWDQCVTHVDLEREGQDREVLARPSPCVVAKLADHEGSVVFRDACPRARMHVAVGKVCKTWW